MNCPLCSAILIDPPDLEEAWHFSFCPGCTNYRVDMFDKEMHIEKVNVIMGDVYYELVFNHITNNVNIYIPTDSINYNLKLIASSDYFTFKNKIDLEIKLKIILTLH